MEKFENFFKTVENLFLAEIFSANFVLNEKSFASVKFSEIFKISFQKNFFANPETPTPLLRCVQHKVWKQK